MGRRDHPKTFLLVAIFSQSTPSCLKVMGWKRAGGYVVMCRRLCGGGLLDYNVISWDWGTPIPIPIPSPSRLTIYNARQKNMNKIIIRLTESH